MKPRKHERKAPLKPEDENPVSSPPPLKAQGAEGAAQKQQGEAIPPEPKAEEGDHPAPLDRVAKERDEYLDRLQRTAADFANYQKRMQRETEEMRKYAASPIALDLLGILDNFHRALGAAEGNVDPAFLTGFRLIEEQLKVLLGKHGIEPIEALNQPFDPNLHDALMEVEDANVPNRTVLEELEKGYRIHDRLLRPSRVKVSRSNPPPVKDDIPDEESCGER